MDKQARELVFFGNNWCGNGGHLHSPQRLVMFQCSLTLEQQAAELEKLGADYLAKWGHSEATSVSPLIKQMNNLAAEWRAQAEAIINAA